MGSLTVEVRKVFGPERTGGFSCCLGGVEIAQMISLPLESRHCTPLITVFSIGDTPVARCIVRLHNHVLAVLPVGCEPEMIGPDAGTDTADMVYLQALRDRAVAEHVRYTMCELCAALPLNDPIPASLRPRPHPAGIRFMYPVPEVALAVGVLDWAHRPSALPLIVVCHAQALCTVLKAASWVLAFTIAYRSAHSILLRSEEHTSELQSRGHLVCRLLLEEK